MSALLLIGLAAQLAVAQVEFVHNRLPQVAKSFKVITVPPSAEPPETRLILIHVRPGEPIIYETGTNGPVELFEFFRLSYWLAPRNQIWWAASVPIVSVEDWWQDVSGGPAKTLALAADKHARYVMFSRTNVPAGLHYVAAWRMSDQIALVELGRP